MKEWSGKIIAVLIGALISLSALVATFAATSVSEADVVKMITLESPYVQDRSLILYRLEQIENKLDRLLEQ